MVGRYSWSDGARSEDKYERPPELYEGVRQLLQQLSFLSKRLRSERSRLEEAEAEIEGVEDSKLKRLQSRHIAAALKAMKTDTLGGASALFIKEIREIQRKGSSDNPLGAPLWEALFANEELAKPPLLPLLWELLECVLEHRKLFRTTSSGTNSLLGTISQRRAAARFSPFAPRFSSPAAASPQPSATAFAQAAYTAYGNRYRHRRGAQYS